MAEAPVPMIYQVLFRPKPNWSALAEERQLRIESHQDTLGDQLTNAIFGEPEPDTVPLLAGDEARLEELRAKDARHTFEVNARVVAFGENGRANPRDAIQQLATAFSSVGHSCYAIKGSVSTGTNARTIVKDVRERRFHHADHDRLRTRLPWTQNLSRTIVADWLLAAGHSVVDVFGPDRANEHELTRFAEVRGGRVVYPTDDDRS